MIVYKTTRNNLLYPIFLGFLFMLLSAVPLKTYLHDAFSNTDTFNTASLSKPLESASLTKQEFPEIATSTPQLSAPIGLPSTPVYDNAIIIDGHTIPYYYNATNPGGVSPLAGSAYRYTAANFIYAHNSADAFGLLFGLASGAELTIIENGTPHLYRVAYTDYNHSTTQVDARFTFLPGSSKLALMTCAPWVQDGNLDASRFVVVVELAE